MIIPSAQSFKFKFPEFAEIDDATIEFAIEEAQTAVDDTWLDTTNSTLGLLYYAAHLIMVAQSRAQSATGQMISSERVGEIAITYKTPNQDQLVSELSTTPYGVRYKELARLNNPGIAVI